MPRWEHSIHINASPDRVWDVISDIDRWPEWTPSVLTVKKVTEGPLAHGTTARVHAKGTPESTWTVSESLPPKSFTWGTKVRGAATTAGHVIEPTDSGAKVTLSLEVRGIAATLFKPFLAKGISENLRLEAEGLKRQSEGPA
ncbi:MAG: SRPBCC family protein [Dehalococcoidia bacterium]|nr:SRPBCC family protein [Dehalococcoidia bacterium]